MPDISMCPATDCPLSRTCHRHADSGTQPTPGWQAYALFLERGDKCEDYWPKQKEPKR